MVFIAGKFAADEILCQLPPHTLRIDLQARCWKSDNDPDSAIVDSNNNGIPIEFVLLGFTPFFGNLGMRSHEEFIRIAYIGVSPSHRLLPPRCVSTSIISGKTSQKNFISFFQTLYNNRINIAEVITSTKFAQKSFNQRDPLTGEDGAKINFNAVEFKDRAAEGNEEKKLIVDINNWLEKSGGEMVGAALKSRIAGSNLIELPLGENHEEAKEQFILANPKVAEQTSQAQGLQSLPAGAGTPGAKNDVPQPQTTKQENLTEAQLQVLREHNLPLG